MFQLASVLVFVLQFEGISGQEEEYLYKPGQDAILPCGLSNVDPGCQNIRWFFNRDPYPTFTEVSRSKVLNFSARADRLSLASYCSLVIKTITAEDAGLYSCQLSDSENFDRHHLIVLTISPDPPDSDPKIDGKVKLWCSLRSYSDYRPCEGKRIRWVDESGTELRGEGVGYKLEGQKDCDSILTVKRQLGHNRKYTCQLVDWKNSVMIDDHYTPDFIGGDQPDISNPVGLYEHTYVIAGAVLGGLVVLLFIAAVLIKHKKRDADTTGGPGKHNGSKENEELDEAGSGLTYATVRHTKQRPPAKMKVKVEDEVTYSEVTAAGKAADSDPSSLYNSINLI